MAHKPTQKSPHLTYDGYAYLTKRLVVSKAQAAGKIAASRAMATMGYIVASHGQWVIKKYQDGTVERIVKIGI